MSKKGVFAQDYFRMRENIHIMQTHEAVVDMISGRSVGCNLLDAFTCGLGQANYPSEFVEYVESSDEDFDDDLDRGFGSPHNRYCGFTPNFLDRGVPKLQPAITFRTAKRVSPEEAAKNAKELVDEEEKLKTKAEKKKQKKMRQRERRRLEKLEKENADKSKKVDHVLEKTKSAEKEYKQKNKTNNASVPPDPGPKTHIVSDNSDSSDEKTDDEESVTEELEELDLNSCFVTNAAAIAKRKLEQKPKSDWKDKKEGNIRKQGAIKTSTEEPQNKEESEETSDFVKKSRMLATTGNDYAVAGNLEMAVKYFTDAIKYNPKEFKLFGNRSFCYEKMQQYEKALADADIALSLSPTWIKGLYRKGKALVGLKRYYDACLTYKEVLKLDSSCTDAAQELMRVQIMQLMEMGFTRERSSNALIIHGTVEKALEALSGLQGNIVAAPMHSEVSAEEEWKFAERKSQPSKVPLSTVSQNQLRPNPSVKPSPPELFPIWVGDLVPEISDSEIYELFCAFGPVYSVKVLQARRCAFVNFTNKDHCERAIRDMHGYAVAGTTLVVRYPDRVHAHLGASKAAATDTAKINKLPDECFFWRTTGCIKNNRCAYRHVPEHKGIDAAKAKF